MTNSCSGRNLKIDYMKFLLVYGLFLFSTTIFSQEITEEYILDKTYKGNHLFEKLILFSNGKYFRKKYNTGHQFESFEEKGNWYMRKDTLTLSLKKLIAFPEDKESEWVDFERRDTFILKRNCIIPVFKQKLYKQFKLKKDK